VLSLLTTWDAEAMNALHELRWAPLTAFFVLVSAWWVKWPVLAAVGAFGDTRAGWRLPRAALAASLAAGLGALAATGIKEIFDRARPPLGNVDVTAVVAVPGSPSFPSGHAATAFAAATVVAALHPRLRLPALAIAALVALSRVYLGVHYWSDVVVGSALGVAVGLLVAVAAKRLADRGDRDAAPVAA
jgi:undecaprenyl-diphosphatase